jgi:hypothetical protein
MISIDRALGRKLYPILVKMDAKSALSVGYVPEIVPKIVWDKRSKLWKEYGLSMEEITNVTAKYCAIKPLHGFNLWFNLIKARSAIRDSIKKGRIVFKDCNHVEYTNNKRGYSKFTTTFDDLAEIFIGVYRKGFPKEKIVQILNNEYNKRRKV